MRPDTAPTSTRRDRTHRGARTFAMATAAVLVLVLAGCSSQDKVDVGPAGPGGPGTGPPGSGATAPPATGAPVTCLLQNGGTVPCDPTNLPQSDPPIIGINCESAPASTAVGMPGGGEIVCDPLPGQTEPGSPGGLPETTIPGDDDATVSTVVQDPAELITTTTLLPDNTHGVLHGSAQGGLDCAPDQACPAIGIIVAGTVVAEGPGGNRVTGEIDRMGFWGIRLPPGIYRITVEAEGADHCDPTTATVAAGTVTEVNLTCGRPM